MSYTKGPWDYQYDNDVGPDDDYFIEFYSVHVRYDNIGRFDREDDAKLAAAAPDLLEALEDMLSGWKYIRSTHGDLYGVGWDRAQDKAEAAIAKAKGEGA